MRDQPPGRNIAFLSVLAAGSSRITVGPRDDDLTLGPGRKIAGEFVDDPHLEKGHAHRSGFARNGWGVDPGDDARLIRGVLLVDRNGEPLLRRVRALAGIAADVNRTKRNDSGSRRVGSRSSASSRR